MKRKRTAIRASAKYDTCFSTGEATLGKKTNKQKVGKQKRKDQKSDFALSARLVHGLTAAGFAAKRQQQKKNASKRFRTFAPIEKSFLTNLAMKVETIE